MTANDHLARSGHTLLALRLSLETHRPAKRRKYPRTSQEGRSRQLRRLVQAPLLCVRALVRMALPLKGLRPRYKPSNIDAQSNANALLSGKVLASTDRRAYTSLEGGSGYGEFLLVGKGGKRSLTHAFKTTHYPRCGKR